jgi:ABC-type Mn2+/Zn2+ transport system permease subunit
MTWEDRRLLVMMFWPSLLAGASTAVSAGVTGLFVVLRRESFLAIALPQVVALGLAIGLREGWPPMIPGVAVLAAALLLVAGSRRLHGAATILPALYVAGISGSVLAIAHAGAHLQDIKQILTGYDVTVSPEEAFIASPILLAGATIVAMFWRRWLLLAQAPVTAEIAGVSPVRWHTLFLTLLSSLVLMGTSTLGWVLVISMLFLPAATVLPWTRRIPASIALAAVVALVCVIVGFELSNGMDWPLSHSISLVGCILAGASLAVRRIVDWKLT